MRNIKILTDIDSAAFNIHAPHPMQAYEWGEARKKTGIRVVRFGVFDNGILEDAFQMTVHKLPKLSQYIGYIPRSKIPTKELAIFLRTWAQKERVIFIKWEPYALAEAGGASMQEIPHMRKSPHSLFPEWNLEVDLTPSEEHMLTSCDKGMRYSIRSAERIGVTVTEMSNDEGYKIFSDLYFGTVGRQKYHGHTPRYHKIIWESMRENGIARIFVAFYKGEPLAAFEIFFFHDRAYYPYGGTASVHRNIPGAAYLMWQAMLTAKREGKLVFDLWGSLPPGYTRKHSWQGFTFFKKRFGSTFVHMTPSHDLVVSSGMYWLYTCAYFLRKLIWKTGVV